MPVANRYRYALEALEALHGSEEGARANALFVSLLASCQLHRIEPWAYIRDLLCLLASWPRRRVLELAPAFWHETLKQEDTQQRLTTNVFRSVTLADHSPSCDH
jgi:transposase